MAKFQSLAEQSVEEESYFVSMTDMMVGLLFIFILMLMYFALQYQKSNENLQNAEDTRAHILQEIKEHLESKNIKVTVDEESGILRLPEESLRFPSGQAEIMREDQAVIESLATALNIVLPCYSKSDAPRPKDCPATAHSLEAVFIEGHTDSDRVILSKQFKDNWELSVARSVNTYRSIISSKISTGDNNILPNLKNRDEKYLLSVSGYGENRPISDNDTDENKRMNRRIDLRFVMSTPKQEIVDPIIQEVKEGIK